MLCSVIPRQTSFGFVVMFELSRRDSGVPIPLNVQCDFSTMSQTHDATRVYQEECKNVRFWRGVFSANKCGWFQPIVHRFDRLQLMVREIANAIPSNTRVLVSISAQCGWQADRRLVMFPHNISRLLPAVATPHCTTQRVFLNLIVVAVALSFLSILVVVKIRSCMKNKPSTGT
jgi:hypothetical protein